MTNPLKSRFQSLIATALVLSTSATLTITTNSASAQGFAINLGVNLLSRAVSRRLPGMSMGSSYGGSNGYNSNNYGSGYSSNRDIQASNAAINLYNKAVGLVNAKRYEEATPLLEQAAQINPNTQNLNSLLGLCRLEAGRNQEAMQCFVTAESRGDHYAGLEYQKGLCAVRLGDYQTAGDAFQKYAASNHRGNRGENAQNCLAIVEHNFLNPSNDDYLADAQKEGTRRWNTNGQAITVYISENPSLNGYRPEFAAILKQSFADWTKGTNGKVKFALVTDPTKAQIKCDWTDNQQDFDSDKELGVTKLIAEAGGDIETASITLHTLVGKCGCNPSELFPKAKAVALHEIGHALGLEHSSQAFDIMYPTVAPAGLEFNLTRRDLNTVVALYNDKGQNIANMSDIQTISSNFSKSK